MSDTKLPELTDREVLIGFAASQRRVAEDAPSAEIHRVAEAWTALLRERFGPDAVENLASDPWVRMSTPSEVLDCAIGLRFAGEAGVLEHIARHGRRPDVPTFSADGELAHEEIVAFLRDAFRRHRNARVLSENTERLIVEVAERWIDDRIAARNNALPSREKSELG